MLMTLLKIVFCVMICVPFILLLGLLFEKTVADAEVGTRKKVKTAGAKKTGKKNPLAKLLRKKKKQDAAEAPETDDETPGGGYGY